MLKPEIKLKKHAGVVLRALSKFPQEKVPHLPDGKSMDVKAFNEMPEIIKSNTDLYLTMDKRNKHHFYLNI